MDQNLSLHETLWRWVEDRRAFVAATVVATRGSAPRDPGAKMLIPRAGDPIGTVGGGAPERQVIEVARSLLERGGPPQILHVDLTEEAACGGKMEVFLEPYRSEKQIVIVGAGHVGRAVAPLLVRLGWDVTVIDPRAERLTDPAFAHCRTVGAGFLEAAERIVFADGLFVLIMTPEHRFDEEIAALCIEKPWRWLGVIGSRRKATQFRQHLLDRGLPEARVARVRIPVGLEIGSDTPEEIAVSIAAELIRETARPRASGTPDA
jgi:xanthine dehydrogenase accessory factor